jgi:hypothetical protein
VGCAHVFACYRKNRRASISISSTIRRFSDNGQRRHKPDDRWRAFSVIVNERPQRKMACTGRF